MLGFFDMIFGCWHKNYSFPITDRKRVKPASKLTGTYIVCLDCGKEFPYDWDGMKVVANAPKAHKHQLSVVA